MSAEPQIELVGIDKHYGEFHALKNISLTIEKGQFVALVGPSGCGKSTLLRSLAGLETISGGTMKIAGRVMNNVPPRKRDVAMVFQTYALYPHMTVLENMTYSLRLKGTSKAEANRAAEDVAETTGLSALLGRYPRELSGGQRQRVAMGRAIIRNPKAFLFDDQIEAMTMADHVVVMRDGVIEQQGSPLELYDRPISRFVAGFIGSPAMNFVAATVSADGCSAGLNTAEGGAVPLSGALEAGRRIVVGLRPEHLVTLVQSERTGLRTGDHIALTIAPEHVHVFDADSGLRI